MKLPPPRQPLANCIWLPRIIAKARALDRGELEPDYVSRFCHPSGTDGQFLAFFNLSRDEIVNAARRSDDEVVAWFRSLKTATAERVAEWNQVAVNLGRPGFPMADRMVPALAATYKHLNPRKFETVFKVLEADEGIG